jgi:hypothetical protein
MHFNEIYLSLNTYNHKHPEKKGPVPSPTYEISCISKNNAWSKSQQKISI